MRTKGKRRKAKGVDKETKTPKTTDSNTERASRSRSQKEEARGGEIIQTAVCCSVAGKEN